jgi:hypothetical protein
MRQLRREIFCHFTRILVDVDLTSTLRERILVERNDTFIFMFDIKYEILPPFLTHVRLLGILLRIASTKVT